MSLSLFAQELILSHIKSNGTYVYIIVTEKRRDIKCPKELKLSEVRRKTIQSKK